MSSFIEPGDVLFVGPPRRWWARAYWWTARVVFRRRDPARHTVLRVDSSSTITIDRPFADGQAAIFKLQTSSGPMLFSLDSDAVRAWRRHHRRRRQR